MSSNMKILLVGGAVRDLLLGIDPKDKDWVILNASQADIDDLMERGFTQVGKDFPVFLHPVTGEEFALARRERKTGVGYNGFTVETDAVTLEDDLSRRDLTINSIAHDPINNEFFDPFNGEQDLKDKVLRHTTSAFAEDPLRVIRLARFAARYAALGFTIAPETVELAKQMVDAGELDHLPNERFFAELQKVLQDEKAYHERFFQVLQALGVFQKVKFFKLLFNDAATVHAAALHLWTFDAADRLDLLMVTASTAEALRTAGGPTHVQQVLRTLQLHKHAVLTSQSAFEIENALSAFRAWQNSPNYLLLMKFVQLSMLLGSADPDRLGILSAAVRLGTKATAASMFPEHTGVALGAALREARVKAIRTLFT